MFTLEKKQRERSSNFELLRIVSIFLVLCMHIYHQGTVNTEYVLPFNQWLGLVVNAIGNIGVSCFILISGYWGVKLKLDRFIQIIILTTIYSILVCILITPNNIREILLAGFNVPFHQNWYISCYLMLMVLSPIINNGIQLISRSLFEKILLSQFVFYCLFVFVQPHEMKYVINSGGKCFAYFIFIYMVGRYIRLYRDIGLSRKLLLGTWLLMSALACITTVAGGLVLGMGLEFPKALVDCSPFIFISSISVFYLFKGIKFQSILVNKISAAILSIYLLERIRIPIDLWMFDLQDYAGSYFYATYFILLVILTFFLGYLIDCIRLQFSFVENWLVKYLVGIIRYFYKVIITICNYNEK